MAFRGGKWLGLTVVSLAVGAAQTGAGGAGYVDPALCATCHRPIAESYARTGMGRSFGAVEASTRIPEIQGGTFHHEASGESFSLSTSGAKPALRRTLPGFDGAISNILEATLDYRIGSGNHSVSYLHRTASGELVELPLSWYADKGGYWAMSPAYDRPDHPGFSRKVSYRCMFCHNGYPAVESGSDLQESGARFPANLPEGIDCQRCHGPGQAHVDAIRQGRSPELVRGAIVNPAHLGPERQMEICLECHLETTSENLPTEIMRYGRGVFSYRPGEPLGDYVLSFDHAPGSGRDDKFDLVSSPYRLRKSACFLASGGKLTCTTCHNPHDVPRGAAATSYYAQVCRGCHQTEIAALTAAGRHPGQEDCVSCHMPKRRPEDAIHITVTDHDIRRRPEGDPPGLVERNDGNTAPYRGEVVAYYPAPLAATAENELYLAVAQVRFQANLGDGLRRLEAAIAKYAPPQGEFYFRLAEAYRDAGRMEPAIAAYRQACQRAADWRYFYALGTALSASGQLGRSEEALNRARALAPREVVVLEALSAVYVRQGKPQAAMTVLEAAMAMDPDAADTRNNLGIISLELGKTAEAEKYLREAIRLRPEMASTRLNLADLLARRGSFAEARYHFETAIRIDGASAAAHSGYAGLLMDMGNLAAARVQYEEALRRDPQLSQARNNLGSILLQSGDTAGAIREYRLGVAASPDSATAYYNLALALAKTGDGDAAEQSLRSAIDHAPGFFAAYFKLGQLLAARHRPDLAEPYLRKATESPDAGMRKAAQDLLNAAR